MRAPLAVLLALLLVLPAMPASAQSRPCGFQLGFKAIADQIPEMVGGCLEDEHFNTANGNAEQRTTAHHGKGGLLVWRKADNWTAFTDGYWTWVNGPSGLQERLNTARFAWETDPVSVTPSPICEVRRPFRSSANDVTIVDQELFRTEWGTTAMRVRVRNNCNEARLISFSAIAFSNEMPVAFGRPVKELFQPNEEKAYLYGWAIEGQPYPDVKTDSFVWFDFNWARPGSTEPHCVPLGPGQCISADPWLRTTIGWLSGRAGGVNLLRTAAAAGVRVEYGDTPFGALGTYSTRTKVVTMWRDLDAYSEFERAAVLAHELRHAVDDAEGRLEAGPDGCYRAEQRAFQEQSRAWRSLWRGALPQSRNRLQELLNQTAVAAASDPVRLSESLLAAYGEHCA